MSDKYILNEQRVCVPADLMTWGRWLQEHTADRIVAKTTVGDAEVSTVFIGLDHSWGQGPPQIFETMVFGGPHDGHQKRYATWEEAEAGHAATVRMLTATPPNVGSGPSAGAAQDPQGASVPAVARLAPATPSGAATAAHSGEGKDARGARANPDDDLYALARQTVVSWLDSLHPVVLGEIPSDEAAELVDRIAWKFQVVREGSPDSGRGNEQACSLKAGLASEDASRSPSRESTPSAPDSAPTADIGAPEGPATAPGAGDGPTAESERAALVAEVGECCKGSDPLCAVECLVEKALRKRAVNYAPPAAGDDEIASLEDLAARYHSIAHEDQEEDYNAGAIALCETPRCRSVLRILARLRAEAPPTAGSRPQGN